MRRVLVLLAIVAAAPLAAAAAARAEAVMPINTDACPGFAQTYPAEYLFSAFVSQIAYLPPGSYIVPGDDQGTISFRHLGGPNGIRWAISVGEFTAPGEGPNGSIGLPTLTAFASYTYTIQGGEFTTPPDASPGPLSGDGQIRIVRSDGARMWGQGTITLIDGVWLFGISAVHCSLG